MEKNETETVDVKFVTQMGDVFQFAEFKDLLLPEKTLNEVTVEVANRLAQKIKLNQHFGTVPSVKADPPKDDQRKKRMWNMALPRGLHFFSTSIHLLHALGYTDDQIERTHLLNLGLSDHLLESNFFNRIGEIYVVKSDSVFYYPSRQRAPNTKWLSTDTVTMVYSEETRAERFERRNENRDPAPVEHLYLEPAPEDFLPLRQAAGPATEHTPQDRARRAPSDPAGKLQKVLQNVEGSVDPLPAAKVTSVPRAKALTFGYMAVPEKAEYLSMEADERVNRWIRTFERQASNGKLDPKPQPDPNIGLTRSFLKEPETVMIDISRILQREDVTAEIHMAATSGLNWFVNYWDSNLTKEIQRGKVPVDVGAKKKNLLAQIRTRLDILRTQIETAGASEHFPPPKKTKTEEQPEAAPTAKPSEETGSEAAAAEAAAAAAAVTTTTAAKPTEVQATTTTATSTATTSTTTTTQTQPQAMESEETSDTRAETDTSAAPAAEAASGTAAEPAAGGADEATVRQEGEGSSDEGSGSEGSALGEEEEEEEVKVVVPSGKGTTFVGLFRTGSDFQIEVPTTMTLNKEVASSDVAAHLSGLIDYIKATLNLPFNLVCKGDSDVLKFANAKIRESTASITVHVNRPTELRFHANQIPLKFRADQKSAASSANWVDCDPFQDKTRFEDFLPLVVVSFNTGGTNSFFTGIGVTSSLGIVEAHSCRVREPPSVVMKPNSRETVTLKFLTSFLEEQIFPGDVEIVCHFSIKPLY